MRLADEVRGLEGFWARMTRRAPSSPLAMPDRILLDALGLGLEQTYVRLADAPELAAFEQWIVDTAGPPDPVRLARYHGWLDGAPPPDAVRKQLDAIDAMPAVLDEADLAHWDEHGFVIVREAIPADAAGAAEALLWRVLGARRSDPDSWYRLGIQGIMVQHFQDPALDVARTAPRVHKAFAQLWETADLWSRIDRMSFNPPERPDFPFQGPHLHWDASIAPPIPFATQGILYLTDTAADQGALQLVPGFHHRIEAWLESIGDADPRQVDMSGEAMTVPAGAGDLIIWRQDLPHGASPNRSRRPRLAQYVNFYSAELEENPVWR